MIDFIKEMTVGNRWLWFHILAGGFVAKVIYLIPVDWNPVVFVACLAVAWEIFELYKDGYKGYSGGAKGWFADTLGDILGAVLMAWVVVA